MLNAKERLYTKNNTPIIDKNGAKEMLNAKERWNRE